MSEVFLDNDYKGHPKRDCYFYNWGGDHTKNRPSYPREYGARCEFYKEFFTRDRLGAGLEPNCDECTRFKVDEEYYKYR